VKSSNQSVRALFAHREAPIYPSDVANPEDAVLTDARSSRHSSLEKIFAKGVQRMYQHPVRLPLWLTCLSLSLALVLGGVAGSFVGNHKVFASSAVPAVSVSSDSKAALHTSFAPVVKKVMPSIVNVFSSKKVKTDPNNLEPFFNDPFFRRFFDDQSGRPSIPRERKEQSLGSGVVVSPDGYILTNNHVVDDATEVKVSLGDKREFTARVVGKDSKTDLAVLKIDQTGLPAVTFADSKKVEVGDIVLALGNPFGVGQTVTMGIVSATGRGGLGIEEYEDFIQTDAAINPGNSGGALINTEGELIGINTAILSRSGGNQGIGFAIPANLAHNVMDQIVHGGKVTRAFLGVMIQPVTPSIAKAFNLKQNEGALISDVSANSPADRAGLKPGDVVTKLDGQTVADSRALQLTISQMKPGQTVHMSVVRDGAERDYSVMLGEQPGDKSASTLERGGNSADQSLDGVSLETLTPELAREYGIQGNTHGVVVRGVDSDSAAAQAGLQTGDVILEVNRHPVTTIEQMNRYLKDSNSDTTLLFVSREGRTRYVIISK
jgi:serine protease Do